MIQGKILILEGDLGGVLTVEVQLAVSQEEHRKGLMFVKDVVGGMLFVYPSGGKRALWMKNTYIPLEGSWWDEKGVLVSSFDMEPLDLTYHWSQTDNIQFVLELNKGFLKQQKFNTPGRVQLDMQKLNLLV